MIKTNMRALLIAAAIVAAPASAQTPGTLKQFFLASCSSPVTVYNVPITGAAGYGGFSTRSLVPSSGAGNQVKVTFTGSNSGTVNVNNASIGIGTGSGNTAATPNELLFSGAHGYSIGNTTITSDWTKVTGGFTSANGFVVVVDNAGTSVQGCLNGTGANSMYQAAGTASYNSASAAGFAFENGWTCGVSKIQARTCN